MEARLITLSKENTPTPPVDRIRPLAVYSPVRKCYEIALMNYGGTEQWDMINPNQHGFRPGANTKIPTIETLREFEKEWDYPWFIDFSDAYNTIYQPTLIEELNRRREILNEQQL